ncbi:alpha/beta hydrolase [Bacillus shivajii]|uniref:alpha/beta fold hydrolase n=1 Tax=Bacillus shivajii TaxID=1983719 RepID=UPI001CFBA4C7|nr:alpha/beta hydrolase [Bacillus shivajii]UCZ53061.1 alpha/beta hydrolase [Bacillus shivajii]
MPTTEGINEAHIYYEVEGSGEKAIVFIHPPGMGHVTFRRQKQGLQKDFKVIGVDLRGNGRSGLDDRPITMELIADDLIRVMDHAGIECAFFCGYSNGGSIVQEIAIRHPSRVKGIIMIGAFSEVNSFLLRNEFRSGIVATRLKQMPLISYVLAIAHEKDKEKLAELRDYVRRTSPAVLEQYYRMGLAYQSTERLKDIQCPVLLIYGERDDYVHHYRHLFRIHCKTDVSMVLVGETGHQVPTKKGHALNHIMKEFIRNIN